MTLPKGAAAQLQDAFWAEAEALLFRHTAPWELDEALEAWGYAIGPCAAQDLAGLDQVLARHPARPGPVLKRMVAEGRLGKKGGVGFYRYPGGGGAVVDPLIEDLIREEAWFAKTPRADLPDAALIAAMNAALARALVPLNLPETEARALLTSAVGYPAGQALPSL